MRRFLLLGCAVLLARVASAGNVFVPLSVQETGGVARAGSLVTSGVPIPQGRLRHVFQARVIDVATGQLVPAQFETLATWPDGSAKWLLADFQADVAAGGTAGYALTQDPFRPQPAPASPVSVTEDAAAVTIDTGAARFVVPKGSGKLLQSARVGGVELLAAPGADIVAFDAGGAAYAASLDVGPSGASVSVEERGPLRAVVRVEGVLRDSSGNAGPGLLARLQFVAGASTVRAFLTIRNGRAAGHPNNVWDLGASGAWLLEDVSLVLPLSTGGPVAWTAWGEPPAPESGALATTAVLYQESSGGNRWNWPTHVNRFNTVPMTFRGYRIDAGGSPVAAGNRARGVLDASGAAGGVSASVRSFWQNFPKALRAQARPAVEVGLFPREFPDVHELQGGEEKTHEVLLYFHQGDAAAAGVDQVVADLASPLRARPAYEAAARSQALGTFGPRDPVAFPDYEDTVEYVAFDRGVRSFFTQREEIDEYGWRNFGEVFADHETDCGTQCWDCPVSHDNNQYDYDWAALLFWIRNGEPEWLQLGDEGVRHLADIDVYHTDADVAVYGRGMFWHTTHDTNAYTSTHRTYSALMSSACTPYLSGGPALGHLYTEGLALHGYLLGDRRSLEVHAELEQYMRTRYAIDSPGPGYEPRAWANALRAAVAACRRTWDPALYAFARQVVIDSDAAANPGMDPRSFQTSMLMVALGRFLELKAERGELGDADAAAALASLEGYAARVRAEVVAGALPNQDVLDFRYSEGLYMAYKFTPPGDPDKASWLQLGRDFFLAGEQTPFFNTYITCKGEAHVITNGHLHSYFERGRIPEDVRNLRVSRVGDDVVLRWDAVAADVHSNAIVVGDYRVHRSADRPTRFGDTPLATEPSTSFRAAGDALPTAPAPLLFYEVRAMASPGIEGQ